MNSLFEPVEFNRETTQTLGEIRSGAENPLYGAAPADAEEKVSRSVTPLIESAGLALVHANNYRWFLRELARHLRTSKGHDLAFRIELCIRKWVRLGLEPRTVQFLVCETLQRLKAVAANSEVRTQNAEVRSADARPETSQSAESHPYADDHKPVQDSDWMEGLA